MRDCFGDVVGPIEFKLRGLKELNGVCCVTIDGRAREIV
jgi:hypothetical protein